MLSSFFGAGVSRASSRSTWSPAPAPARALGRGGRADAVAFVGAGAFTPGTAGWAGRILEAVELAQLTSASSTSGRSPAACALPIGHPTHDDSRGAEPASPL